MYVKSKKDKRLRKVGVVASDSGRKVFETDFKIEKIISHRIMDGELEFLVKWKDFPVDGATWEPKSHIPDTNLALMSYDYTGDELSYTKAIAHDHYNNSVMLKTLRYTQNLLSLCFTSESMMTDLQAFKSGISKTKGILGQHTVESLVFYKTAVHRQTGKLHVLFRVKFKQQSTFIKIMDIIATDDDIMRIDQSLLFAFYDRVVDFS